MLDQTFNSQHHHITQQLPASKLSSLHITHTRWWSAANEPPSYSTVDQSVDSLHTESNNDHYKAFIGQLTHTEVTNDNKPTDLRSAESSDQLKCNSANSLLAR